MKKIILASVCSLLALTAVGCSSNNETQALNNLSSKLDRVSAIVSSTSTTEVNTVSPMQFSRNMTQSSRYNAYGNMMREEDLRQEVLATTGYLKGSLEKKYKLGKSKTKALVYLTDSLENSITELAGTKLSVRNAVNKIQRYSSNPQNMDSNIANSSYTELNNLMQARAIYLSNLQNTMDEICNILNDSVIEENETEVSNNDQIQISNEKVNQSNKQTSSNNKNEQKDNTIRKNIDTYNNKIINNEKSNNNEYENNVANKEFYSDNRINNDGYYSNYTNAPYNNYLNRNYRFNPNRNTDTFYPRVRNIDTYRFNPNYNGNPYYYGNQYNTPYYNTGYGQIKNNFPQQNLDRIENDQRQTLKNNVSTNYSQENCEECIDNNCENCINNNCEQCTDKSCENCKETISNATASKTEINKNQNTLDASYAELKNLKAE